MGSSGGAVAHPNDAVFKYFLTQPVHAASLIRAVFPEDLVDRLDLERLELVPGSFVDIVRTSPRPWMSRTSRTSVGCGSMRIGGRAWLPCSPIFSW